MSVNRGSGTLRTDDSFARDRPLSLNWQICDPSWCARLGLPLGKWRLQLAIEAVLAAAMRAYWLDPGRWVSYSRRQAWWSGPARQYIAREFNYTNILAAIDSLAELGFLEHDRKKPSSSNSWQSRFRAGVTLIAAMTEAPPALHCCPRELIILRDEHKRPIAYRETQAIRAMRRRLEALNEPLLASRVDLNSDMPCLWREGDYVRLEDGRGIHCAPRPLCRVFNDDFEHGGRFYGPWYQGLSAADRRHILINGEPTAELDFGQTHPRMLAAKAGLDIDSVDIYALPGYERKVVKLGLNIAINAKSRRSAIGAIAQELGGTKHAYAQGWAMIGAINEHHPMLAPYLHTGAGRELQRQDADIAEVILTRLNQRGIVALPIHDSFITERRNAEQLEAEMHGAWSERIGSKAIVNWK